MSHDPETLVRAALYEVAPDLSGQPLDPRQRFRDQFEFDSMDFLRFVVALHRATTIDIAESDYPRLQTLDGCIAYLRERTPATPRISANVG